ncbi:hypothetical protein, partial [Massilia sp.]|uniref:hypothetical protein n=1 Tax=Massilia sp. TaxID=1882437 RepID=UPI0028A640CC
ARRAHNPKVTGSNPVPATRIRKAAVFFKGNSGFFHFPFGKPSIRIKRAALSRHLANPAMSNCWLARL